jgi:hypothetical protein
MYVNAKMIPVEIIPGMGGGIKERSRGGVFKYNNDIFDTFCKCHNIPPPSTTIAKSLVASLLVLCLKKICIRFKHLSR